MNLFRKLFGWLPWVRKDEPKLEFITDKYHAELHHAYSEAFERLKSVGAPVRHYRGKIRVTWKTCHYPGALGYADKKNGRYALTIKTVTELCLDPQGGFQHRVAMAELSHYILMRRESDYYWIRLAGLMPA